MTRTLHTGPKGVCDDCGKPVDIRIGSLIGKVATSRWRAHPELVSAIYEDVRRVTRATSPVIVIRCRTCRSLDPARLMWVGLEGGVGDNPHGRLGGPFCSRCFEGAVRELYESQGGEPVDLPVYYLRPTPAVLRRIRGVLEHTSETSNTQDIEAELF